MIAVYSKLNDSDLRELASAIRSRRVSAPYSELQVNRIVSPNIAAEVVASLQNLESSGFDDTQIAISLELILQDRLDDRNRKPSIDLVTSGPAAPGVANRDTAVVVRELFSHANKSVLVVGYSVYQGASVFEALGRRMEIVPDLDVRLFLNIARPDNDTTRAEILVSRYVQRFRDSQWPKNCRFPDVFYDPRSVAMDKRSSLHAKCVVVDDEQVFVSSANFTKAAQERNIEVGLMIHSAHLATRISRYFHLLSEHKIVIRAI